MMQKEKVELFKNLVSEIHIKKYTQEEFVEIVNTIYQELKENDNSKPQYTYVYGDECNDIWDRFNMTVRDDNDRIKLKFVAFQGEGSYD
jgi:hypothetical protein